MAPSEEEEAQEDSSFSMKAVGFHTIIYAVGNVLAKGVAFLMLPIYTRFLTPADYGVMALIDMTLDIIAIATGARMVQGVFRFYWSADGEEERNGIASTALWLMTGTHIFIGLLIMAAAPFLSQLVFDSDANVTLLRIAGGAIMCNGTILTAMTYLRAKDRSTAVVSLELSKLAVQVVLNLVLLIYYELGIYAIFISNLVASLLMAFGLGIYLVTQVGVHWSRAATRNLARYGLPLVATSVATFLLTFGDRYFLQRAGDSTVVGLYSLAYQFGFLLVMLGSVPYQQVWEPTRFKVALEPDRDAIYNRSFRLISVLTFVLGTGIALYVGDVLRIMATPEFFSAAQYVPPILLAYVLQVWCGQHDIGILLKNRTEFIAFANWLAAGVAMVGYWYFIPRYLAWGAAGVTLGAFIVRYLTIYFFSQLLLHIHYEWGPIVRIGALSIAVGGLSIWLPELPILQSIGLHTGMVFVYLGLIWVLGVLTDDERATIRRVVRSLVQRALPGQRPGPEGA